MKNLAMIACVSQDGGLGFQNQLLWRFPADQKFFKDTTMGHPIVMGSNTYSSIGRSLPGRENIVLSRHDVPGTAKVFHDRSDLDSYLESIDDLKFIIGGAPLYQSYIDDAEIIYLTEVAAMKPADVFFPDFDKTIYKKEILASGEFDGNQYHIVKYSK